MSQNQMRMHNVRIFAHPIGLPRPFSSFSSSPAYVPANRYVDTSCSISAWHYAKVTGDEGISEKFNV